MEEEELQGTPVKGNKQKPKQGKDAPNSKAKSCANATKETGGAKLASVFQKKQEESRKDWVRFTAKIPAPNKRNNEDPEVTWGRKIGAIMDRMCTLSGQNVVIAKWTGEPTDQPLTTQKGKYQQQLMKLPFPKLRQHTTRIRLQTDKDNWIDIRLGFDLCEEEELRLDVLNPIRDQHDALFMPKKLQNSEFQMCKGWFLCFHSDLDEIAIEIEVSRRLKNILTLNHAGISEVHYQVELRLRKISRPKDALNFPQPKAFHIFVDSAAADLVLPHLQEMFAVDCVDRPLGIKATGRSVVFGQCLSHPILRVFVSAVFKAR